MRYRILFLLVGLAAVGSVATAQTLQLVCENWHPRLGQVNDLRFVIDLQRRTCNSNPCKITDGEFSWGEGGGRYEYVVNRLTGEGHVLIPPASEKTAVLKNCRSSETKP